MITCRLVGRLGNQLFITSACYSLSIDNKDIMVLPNVIGGIGPTAQEHMIHKNTIFKKINFTGDLSFIKNIHKENQDQSFKKIDYKENLVLDGYFQSEKYFSHNEKEIRELYEPIPQIENYLQKNYKEIIEDNFSVSVHIRRGDYLIYSDFHKVLGKEYYEKALNQFDNKYNFIFFSDDIEWCKTEFKSLNNACFIKKQDDVLDLYLMSKAKNHIIANSTFSWWGAWLNKSKEKIVYAPKDWFGPKNLHLNTFDLLPKSWNKI